MARRKYEDESDNHDRWLVSYADFITLLFAFFVVMYALSSVNEGKYRVLSNSLVNAFGGLQIAPIRVEPPVPPPAMPRGLPPIRPRTSEALRKEREHLTGVARDLLKVMAPLVEQGKVRVTQSGRGVSVEINASVLFAPGDARLSESSSQALKAVARVLKDDDHSIQVEGHTDSVPIRTALFPSNWELSAVRASSVVRLFIENGIAEKRLSAVGYGPTMPVGSNETTEGRTRNRRVEVVILSSMPDPTTEVPLQVPAPVKK
ncbi:MAG TPA: flagellar motor protein MotD [Noviherbaspirillum sp.]|uniref:flagellar motor protein MotD n=1 Tax=Noviherbaspirillum sp. TaxID=1926288 RepID=UPI002B48F931|nr:flagellar motor protein MotD [Noviherbaspirillum sp.]HJV88476.1 flagellar motor protein MotD [Noviherbaspirillum sp.]